MTFYWNKKVLKNGTCMFTLNCNAYVSGDIVSEWRLCPIVQIGQGLLLDILFQGLEEKYILFENIVTVISCLEQL